MSSIEQAAVAAPARERGAPLAALAGWVGFVLLLLYAVFIGGGWPGIHLVSLRAISLALIAVTLVGWFVAAWRHPAWRPTTAIWPTLLIPPVVLALTTLTSRLPRLGLEYVAWAVLLMALYLVLVRVLATDFARDRIGALAAMLALVIGVVYIGTVVLSWLEWWSLAGSVGVPPLRPLFASLTFGTPNSVLTVQLLLSVVAFAGLGTATRERRLLLGAITAITAIVVVLTGSRGGWLGLGGAIVIVGGIWLLLAIRDGSLVRSMGDRARERRSRWAVGATVLGAFVVAIMAAPAILARLSGSGDGGRIQYFTAAWRMFEDAPLMGTGPGTWAVQRAAYTRAGELDYYIPHAHDIYLQTLAELGIVGFIAGALALLPVAWLIVRALRSSDLVRRRWAWATAFILVYLGLHQVLDFYPNMPTVMLMAAIPIAILDATSERRIGLGPLRLRRAPEVARAALWLVCLAAVVVLARTESLASSHQEAVDAVQTADWNAAREPAMTAAAEDPEMTAYQVTRGIVASALGDWQVAADAFGRAVAVDDLPQSWLGLAQAQLELGAPSADVAADVEQALRIGRQQPAIVYAAGVLYDRLGRTDEADAAYAGAIAALPSLAGDASWTTEAHLAPRFPGILEQATAATPERAWQIALMADDPDRARELASAAAPNAQVDPNASLIIDAWEGEPDATARLFALADAAPRDAELLSWAARIARRSGDVDRAERYQRLGIFLASEGGSLQGTEIRIDPDGYFHAVPAGTITGYAGHYLYRRPLPPDLLAPGLSRLIHSEGA